MPQLSVWLTSPLLPATVLLTGAVAIGLVRRFLLARLSHWPAATIIYRVLPVLAVLAAIVALWSLRRPVSLPRLVLILPPTLGADLALWFRLEAWGRLFELALLWPALGLSVFHLISLWAGGEEATAPPDWSRWLPLLAVACVVLAAADWLTLAAALVLFDLLYLALFASPTEPGWSFLSGGLGVLATLAAACVLVYHDHSLILTAGESLPFWAGLLLTLVALSRLAPYPLHFWLPDPQETPLPAWRWPLRFSSSLFGLYLLTRITPLLDRPAALVTWSLVAGVVGCLVAALLAWLGAQRQPAQVVPLLGLYQVSLALLAWAVLDEWLVGFWLALNLTLATTVWAMQPLWRDEKDNRPLAWWRAVPDGLAAASLAGLPLTVGLFVRVPLYRTLLADRRVGWLTLLLLAEGVLTATLLRLWGVLEPGAFARRGAAERPPWSLRGTAVWLAFPLLLLGVFPFLATWLTGYPPDEGWLAFVTLRQLAQAGIALWATLLLPPLIGYGLYRQRPTWPDSMVEAEAQWVLALRLGWLHRAVARSLSRARQALWTLGTLLHGEGYLAWTILSLVLIFLLVIGR